MYSLTTVSQSKPHSLDLHTRANGKTIYCIIQNHHLTYHAQATLETKALPKEPTTTCTTMLLGLTPLKLWILSCSTRMCRESGHIHDQTSETAHGVGTVGSIRSPSLPAGPVFLRPLRGKTRSSGGVWGMDFAVEQWSRCGGRTRFLVIWKDMCTDTKPGKSVL